ncbi:MAG: glycosyltransferase family 2 protein [Deltaproteobacteria bacterium]|nr:glycosyltransferase family 2 protein [Deltaproteobacteria bacterium]MBW2309127.1 glycosyltransferase family 2 protein [Deltaproteobacteria bacterium]
MNSTRPMISIVVPIKDEAPNVLPLILETKEVMESLPHPFEIIFVDDGSTDGSYDIIKEAHKEYPFVGAVKFRENRGQMAAFEAGFRRACGEIVVTMDGDLQNDPGDIPRLLQGLENSDMVCGYRARRMDSWVRRLSSRIANGVRRKFTHDDTIDVGCSIRAFKKECLKNIKFYHGMHRFFPTLFRLEGYTIAQIPVNHRPRLRGKTKYGVGNRLFRALRDLMAVRWMIDRHIHYHIEEEW